VVSLDDLLSLAEADTCIADVLRDPWLETIVGTYASRRIRLGPRTEAFLRFRFNLAAFGSAVFDPRWLEPSTVDSAPDLPIWRHNDPGLSE
jgi:hypothetical protein